MLNTTIYNCARSTQYYKIIKCIMYESSFDSDINSMNINVTEERKFTIYS